MLKEAQAPKKLLIFSQKKAFFIFQEMENPPPKKIIFRETFYISGSNFLRSKSKRFLVFQEVTCKG